MKRNNMVRMPLFVKDKLTFGEPEDGIQRGSGSEARLCVLCG